MDAIPTARSSGRLIAADERHVTPVIELISPPTQSCEICLSVDQFSPRQKFAVTLPLVAGVASLLAIVIGRRVLRRENL